MRRVSEANPIAMDELRALARGRFGDMVKGVVDLRREILVGTDEWLEFDSMINLRPSFGNRSRGVDDASTRTAIAALVERLVRR
jgi:hypothetical protein